MSAAGDRASQRVAARQRRVRRVVRRWRVDCVKTVGDVHGKKHAKGAAGGWRGSVPARGHTYSGLSLTRVTCVDSGVPLVCVEFGSLGMNAWSVGLLWGSAFRAFEEQRDCGV